MTYIDTLPHTPWRPAAVKLPAGAWRRWLPTGMLVLLLVVGIALRLTGLTRPSLWLDEAYSLYVAAHRFAQSTAFVAGSDAHPPLYYLLLHVWLLFGPSVLTLRLLSAVASSSALVTFFVLSRRLAQRRVALLATALMACSAFQVWYAQEARLYALVTLAVLLAVYALVRAWQQGGAGAWVVFTSALLAAFYLDSSAFYDLLFNRSNLAQANVGLSAELTEASSGPALSGYARVWRVLSHVDTRTAGAAVPPWLAQHYHLVRQQHFVGVTVQLYHVSTA